MQLKYGQTGTEVSNAGTWGGLLFSIDILGAANDYSILPADFDFSTIQVNITLVRNKVPWPMQIDNLNQLGTYAMYKNNYDTFVNGQVLVPDAAGAKMHLLRTAWLKFASPVNLRQGDILTAQVQWNRGGLSNNVDSANTFVDFIFTQAIGYEQGISQLIAEVVQQNITNYNFVNANYVKRIMFINYDQNSWVNPVLTNVNVASDKLNYTTSLYETIAGDNIKWPMNIPYQYGATQLAPTIRRTLNMSPQNISIYEAGPGYQSLNNCRVGLAFTPANVNSAQNWVISERLYVDQRNVDQQLKKLNKHAQENAARLLTGTGS